MRGTGTAGGLYQRLGFPTVLRELVFTRGGPRTAGRGEVSESEDLSETEP